MPVLWKSASVWMLLFGVVILSASIRADGGLLDMFDEGE